MTSCAADARFRCVAIVFPIFTMHSPSLLLPMPSWHETSVRRFAARVLRAREPLSDHSPLGYSIDHRKRPGSAELKGNNVNRSHGDTA